MKKFFACILAALLLACSPAFASVGWDASAPEKAAPCTVKVALYEYTPTVQYGGSYYAPFTGVVQPGTLVRFAVTADIAEGVDLEKLTLEVKCSNMSMQAPEMVLNHGKNTFEFVGLVEGKGAATVTATLKYKGLTVAEMPRIAVDGNTFTFDKVSFVCDENGKISYVAYNGRKLVRDLSGNLDLTAEELKDLNKTLAWLGWSLDGSFGYMSEAAIEKHMGGAWEVKAQGIFGAETSLSVGENVSIPQTGEPAGMAAFALTGLASIAIFRKKHS